MEKIRVPFFSIVFLWLLFIIFLIHPSVLKSQAGVYHLVKKNETIWSISRAYGVPVNELAKVNNIIDINALKENSVLFIPSACQVIDDAVDMGTVNDGKDVATEKTNADHVKDGATNKDTRKAKSLTETKDSKTEGTEASAAKNIQKQMPPDKNNASESDKKINSGRNVFVWPVRGEVKARFGVQPNKTTINWIKIIARARTNVKAAESGTVIFSSKLPVFGETIIIRHKDKFSTVYTHLKKRLVKIDKSVRKGEAIAVLGEKDEADDVYMNFEIRLKGKAYDPLLFFP
jgi:lipoprotein NlpD